MKIGQTIQTIGDIKPSQLVKLTNILGIEHIEFDPTVFDDIEAVIPMVGNKSIVLHAPFYSWWDYDLSSIKQSDKIDKFMLNVESFAKDLDAQAIVVHPPLDPEKDESYFIKNLDLLGKFNLTVFLENMPGQKLPDFKKWYFDTKNKTTAKIEICFDVPHSFLTHGADGLFNVPKILLPDIHYIHISELSADKDCHWPFGTPGGKLPYDKFEDFISKINFDGTINMEMHPSSLVGIENLINSYLKLKKLGNKFAYIRKKIRFSLLKPIILKKLKNVTFAEEPVKHNIIK